MIVYCVLESGPGTLISIHKTRGDAEARCYRLCDALGRGGFTEFYVEEWELE